MNVVMLSTDRTICENGSAAQSRMIEYGTLVAELHVIVFTLKGAVTQALITNEDGAPRLRIARNVYIYPTESTKKIAYFRDAFSLGKKILEGALGPPERRVKKGQAADLKKNKSRKSLVIRSIFGSSKTVNLNMLRRQAPSGWLITTQDPFETGTVGVRLKRVFEIPLQMQIHTDFLSRHFWKESWKNKMRVLMAERNLKQADCVRVVSERVKKSVEKAKLLAKHVTMTVLPIYIDIAKKTTLSIFADVKRSDEQNVILDLHREYPNHDFVVLMASRLSKEKNIPMALSAMARVVKKHPEALLVIIGDGPEKENLEKLSKSVRENVVFLPWTKDLDLYYETADLFLLTSNYEGYGRTVIEAQAHGLPVLMTDVGCAGETVEDGRGAIIVPIKNSALLARRLIEIIENPALRTELQNGARLVNSKLMSKEDHLEAHRHNWLACAGENS
jgi:glycosyltransferase involved in cell wall biosynthesis